MTSFDEDLKYFSQNIYSEKQGKIPSGWKKVHSEENKKSGFYGEVYKRNNEVIIVYRGTDIDKGNKEKYKDIFIGDAPMGLGLKSGQYKDAKALFDKVEKAYSGKRIVLTGHSLGGSLAQIVSAETGRKAVTFNAYGTGDILYNMGYKNQRLLDITNYGNKDDNVFKQKINRQPGVTFITDTDLNPKFLVQTGNRHVDLINFDKHKLENMDSLEKSVRLVSGKGDKHADRLLKGSISYDDYDKKAEILVKLKEPQESKLEKIKNKIFNSKTKEKDFDEKSDYSAYINEITKTNKIYTKEDIASMSDEELEKNKKAIDYQKKTMGIPTSKQAKNSGMVYVSGYTRGDGVEVKSYYRTRPGIT